MNETLPARLICVAFVVLLAGCSSADKKLTKPEGPHSRIGSPEFRQAMGAVLGSYIALAEAGKYAVTDVGNWFVVEAGAAAIQFTIFGLFLGLIHRKAFVAVDVPST